MIIGLDISTSVVGVALFNNNYSLQELSYLKFKQGVNLFTKLDEFISFYEEKFKKEHFDFDEEETRPYFEVSNQFVFLAFLNLSTHHHYLNVQCIGF